MTKLLKKNKEPYLREVQKELKKVNWTTKKELKTLTKVVLGSAILFGFGIYIVDVCIGETLNVIRFLTRLITG